MQSKSISGTWAVKICKAAFLWACGGSACPYGGRNLFCINARSNTHTDIHTHTLACAIAGRPIQGALHNLLLPIMQEAHAVCEAAGQCPGGDTGSKSDHKLGQRVACVPVCAKRESRKGKPRQK
eukprot:1161805-Pelagomonas_calceolata.AAC.3